MVCGMAWHGICACVHMCMQKCAQGWSSAGVERRECTYKLLQAVWQVGVGLRLAPLIDHDATVKQLRKCAHLRARACVCASAIVHTHKCVHAQKKTCEPCRAVRGWAVRMARVRTQKRNLRCGAVRCKRLWLHLQACRSHEHVACANKYACVRKCVNASIIPPSQLPYVSAY